jgi:hypothetical protein
MKEDFAWRKIGRRRLSRRNLICGAGAIAGAGLLRPRPVFAGDNEHSACALANPIPGGGAPFKPFGVVVHHNPLNAANQLAVAKINDPSQITDFDGFVGLTNIHGRGTVTGESTILSFRADMGFSQGHFIGVDGRRHEGTFAFV